MNFKNKRVNYFKGRQNMKAMKLSMGRIFWMVACLALIVSLCLSIPSDAKTAKEINGEVNEALTLFYQHVKGGKKFLNDSKGVLVIPNIVKAGLGIGGEYGEGALRIRGKTVEYYSIAAGSAGFQIGAQKMNLILAFMQDEALKKFRTSSGWKAGVDASVAFVDVGAEKSLDTVKAKDPVVGFVFGQKGAMAGATVEGAKFTKLKR